MGRSCTRIVAAVASTLALALLLIPTSALHAQEQPVEAEINTAPVEIDGQVLYRVRGASSLSAEARAQATAQRIVTVAADRSIPLTALQVKDIDNVAWIVAGDQRLAVVLDADARLEQLSRGELALAHLTRIRQAIDEYRQARSAQALERGIRDSLAATVVFVPALAVLFLLTRWLRFLGARWIRRRMESERIQSLQIVHEERVLALLNQVLSLVLGVAIAVLTFQYLSFTLDEFVQTRPLARNLLGLVIGPLRTMGLGLIAQIPNVAFLAVLFVVLRVLLRLLRAVFDAIGRGALKFGGFEPEWAQPTYKIVRFMIIAFGVVVAYPYFPGAQSDAFKGVSLFVGVVFSLGSSSAVSNVIAGYLLIYRRAFRMGDVVKIGDALGEVTDFRLQVTRIRTFKNEEIVIPNSQILGGQVTNYSALALKAGLILHVEAGIGYETPWRQVEAMLLVAAERTPGILRTPAPFVLQRALANYSVTYELNVYCAAAPTMLQVYTDLYRNVLDVFNEYGVQIMTPSYMADPAAPKVVPADQWYLAPAHPPSGPPPAPPKP